LVLGEPAPHAALLARGHRPLEALGPDLASHADGLGRRRLDRGRSGVPDGEEELRVLVLASRSMDPLHDPNPPVRPRTGRSNGSRDPRGGRPAERAGWREGPDYTERPPGEVNARFQERSPKPRDVAGGRGSPGVVLIVPREHPAELPS